MKNQGFGCRGHNMMTKYTKSGDCQLFLCQHHSLLRYIIFITPFDRDIHQGASSPCKINSFCPNPQNRGMELTTILPNVFHYFKQSVFIAKCFVTIQPFGFIAAKACTQTAQIAVRRVAAWELPCKRKATPRGTVVG